MAKHIKPSKHVIVVATRISTKRGHGGVGNPFKPTAPRRKGRRDAVADSYSA